ncbi:MAG: hypothetical protein ACD_58C00166G0003 [uncultured bacterium]|nr:MAG: hypothetical protein ACD_58C00166G0003 [uncultured bacterium]
MNDNVEEIKKRLDIVDFISGYLTLKKAGINYKAPCPFHSEKSPSFMVSPERQIFKCFGCSESGDVFSFLMKMEGLNFPEALEMLANRAGVIIDKHVNKEVYQKEKDVKTRLYKINKLAAQVYHKILLEHPSAQEARDYLKKRKLDNKTIKDFTVGYAPTQPVLANFLHQRGFYESEVRSAGNPDRFKNRIIFPISDQMGNVLGFTGRVLNPNDQPKYLNTPETAIFHKSRVLYGLNVAKQTIKQQKSAIIVEGQMDVLASHQAGVANAVATSGTALTNDHLDILARYSPNVIFAFDQDDAGTKAAKKSIQMAIASGLNAKMVIFPDGIKDAGELVEKDPKLWQNNTSNAIIALDWLFITIFKPYINNELSGEIKKQIAQEIIPFIAGIPDTIEQQHYIKQLVQKLDTKENLIIDAINKVKKINPRESSHKVSHNLTPEEHLIGLLINFPQLIKQSVIKLDWQEFTDKNLAQIYKLLQSCYTKDSCPATNRDSKPNSCDNSKTIVNCFKAKLPQAFMAELEFVLMEIENSYRDFPIENLQTEIINNINRIKQNNSEMIKDKFAKAIKSAEQEGNIQEVKKLLKEFQNAIK